MEKANNNILSSITCPKCGKTNEVKENLEKVFCQYCGTQIELNKGMEEALIEETKKNNPETKEEVEIQILKCNKCENPIKENQDFCPNCGKKIEKDINPSIKKNKRQKNPRKKLSNKIKMIIIAVVAVVFAGLMVLLIVTSGYKFDYTLDSVETFENGTTYNVPSEWIVEEDEDGTKKYLFSQNSNEGQLIVATPTNLGGKMTNSDIERLNDAMVEEVEKTKTIGNDKIDGVKKETVGEYSTVFMKGTDEETGTIVSIIYFITVGKYSYYFIFQVDETLYSQEHKEFLREVVASLVVNVPDTVGDTITNAGVDYTLEKVEYSQGEGWDTPEAGNEYVIVHLKIENNSLAKISYNSFDWAIINSHGQEDSDAFTLINDDTDIGYGDLQPGGSVSGTIVFEQPTDDPELKLVYYDNIFYDNYAFEFEL